MKSIQEIEAGLELDSDEEILRAQLDTANSRIAELERQQSEPFGYFKAEPFGWTDCAETDDGAKALYERPDPRVAELERVQGVLVGALETVVERFSPVRKELIFSKRMAIDKAIAALASVQKPTATCCNDDCRWNGPIEDCVMCGAIGPLCPECHEVVEPDAAQKPEGGRDD